LRERLCCRWLPRVPANTQPSSSSIAMRPRTFTPAASRGCPSPCSLPSQTYRDSAARARQRPGQQQSLAMPCPPRTPAGSVQPAETGGALGGRT
jgi:hypothetical protein